MRVAQGCALAAIGRLRQVTFGPGWLKKYSGRPARHSASCAAFASMVNLAIGSYIFIWLIYKRYWQKKYSFARHVIELFTFEDFEVTITFRSTWFRMSPNSNYWNKSSCHFTRDKPHGYCKNMRWTPRCSLRWSMSDFSVSMDLESVGRLSFFQTKILSMCKLPASQLCL